MLNNKNISKMALLIQNFAKGIQELQKENFIWQKQTNLSIVWQETTSSSEAVVWQTEMYQNPDLSQAATISLKTKEINITPTKIAMSSTERQ